MLSRSILGPHPVTNYKPYTKRWDRLDCVEICRNQHIDQNNYVTYKALTEDLTTDLMVRYFPRRLKEDGSLLDPSPKYQYTEDLPDFVESFKVLDKMELERNESRQWFGITNDECFFQNNLMYKLTRAFQQSFRDTVGKTAMAALLEAICSKLQLENYAACVMGKDKPLCCRHSLFQMLIETDKVVKNENLSYQESLKPIEMEAIEENLWPTRMSLPDILLLRYQKDGTELPVLLVSVKSEQSDRAIKNSLISYMCDVDKLWGLEISTGNAKFFLVSRDDTNLTLNIYEGPNLVLRGGDERNFHVSSLDFRKMVTNIVNIIVNSLWMVQSKWYYQM